MPGDSVCVYPRLSRTRFVPVFLWSPSLMSSLFVLTLILSEASKLDGARLDDQHFRRIDKLGGKNWKEFSVQFKTSVGAENK